MDTYSMRDAAARCAKCGAFMPWDRSRLIEADTGIPAAAPALVERGICNRCEVQMDTASGAVSCASGAVQGGRYGLV